VPLFLEAKLKKTAADKGLSGKRADRYVYGAMNNMGAMHGSKETAKGKRMAKKHATAVSRAVKSGDKHTLADLA
jgi:hypothetical protein